MIQGMNDGHIRVMFGSTEMLGTGVNAQKRAVAVHHLDSPWRPSDLEQREGRAIRKGNEIAKLYADNKVDVIIYAVEKSLDSYKFNLLHNKQLFITQLKTNNMGSRRIDEGSFDEESGMNFPEYVAVLSGNTDLLDKARLEKKVAALESERKNFAVNKAVSEHKLNGIVNSIDGNRETIARMKRDLETFNVRVLTDKDGKNLNPLELDGIDSADVKILAEKLQDLHKNANTNGEYYKIGELYGFRLLVKTDNSEAKEVHLDSNGKVIETLFTKSKENRFFVEGEGNVKYTHNNGRMPADPKLAVNSFLHALEKIPTLIENHQKQIDKLQIDLPVLRQVVKSVWKKEDELKGLKSELAALSRKIDLSLKPIDTSEEKKETHLQPQEKPAIKPQQSEEEKAIQEIQDLMRGKMSIDDYKHLREKVKDSLSKAFPNAQITTHDTMPERFNELKERLDTVISGQQNREDKQRKGMKL
jgi:hypothetical protein